MSLFEGYFLERERGHTSYGAFIFMEWMNDTMLTSSAEA
jgi:hypothetical protein